jgi:hypothetical protein
LRHRLARKVRVGPDIVACLASDRDRRRSVGGFPDDLIAIAFPGREPATRRIPGPSPAPCADNPGSPIDRETA